VLPAHRLRRARRQTGSGSGKPTSDRVRTSFAGSLTRCGGETKAGDLKAFRLGQASHRFVGQGGKNARHDNQQAGLEELTAAARGSVESLDASDRDTPRNRPADSQGHSQDDLIRP
jgi:hypothetical protein